MTTPTLMTAAEMRAHLIEKRAKDAAERAQIEAQEAELRKAWALEMLPPLLETLKEGIREDSRCCDSRDEAEALVDLARSLGYEADVDMEDDTYYAVVKAPELEVALPEPLQDIKEGNVYMLDGHKWTVCGPLRPDGCWPLGGPGACESLRYATTATLQAAVRAGA